MVDPPAAVAVPDVVDVVLQVAVLLVAEALT
jgi:hypothetical protein